MHVGITGMNTPSAYHDAPTWLPTQNPSDVSNRHRSSAMLSWTTACSSTYSDWPISFATVWQKWYLQQWDQYLQLSFQQTYKVLYGLRVTPRTMALTPFCGYNPLLISSHPGRTEAITHREETLFPSPKEVEPGAQECSKNFRETDKSFVITQLLRFFRKL